MTISNALSNALSGLRATGRIAEVTAGNLANALTPGYGRQTVALTASVTGNQGTGVRVVGVFREMAPDLSAARRIADGDLAARAAVADALRVLERAIGTVEDAGGLTDRLQGFEAALRQLGETPESAPRQQAAAEAARDLVAGINRAADATVGLRAGTDRAIGTAVEDLNGALAGIATLNRRIQVATAAGRETAPLVDQRERLIDSVAQLLPIRQSARADGVLEIRTREGILLADIRPQRVDYAVTPVYEPGLAYADGTGTLSGLRLQGIDITPGGPGPQAVRGGLLAGLFEVRDRIGPEAEAGLDALAADLITRTADPAVDPTLAPGDAGLFTDRGAAFALADITGIARRIALSAAVDPLAGGDPARLRDGINAVAPGPVSDDRIIRALADALRADRDVATPPAVPGLAGLLSLADAMAGVTERVATARVAAEAEVSTLATARETLATEETGVIGVDSDAELSRLIEIERAFAANARVIETAARMLEQLERIR